METPATKNSNESCGTHEVCVALFGAHADDKNISLQQVYTEVFMVLIA